MKRTQPSNVKSIKNLLRNAAIPEPSLKALLVTVTVLVGAFVALFFIQVSPAESRLPLSVRMTSAEARRFPSPYGYGLHVTYALENFDPATSTIIYYEVQASEANGEWRTTHSQRPPKYDWANIHGNVLCNDDRYNLPSGAEVRVRVRAFYSSTTNKSLDDGVLSAWSEPIGATVTLWGCPGGSELTNSCVVDVVDQVQNHPARSAGEIGLVIDVPGGDFGNAADARLRPYWYIMGAAKCHIQGFARTRDGTLVWSANSKGFGGTVNRCAGGSGNGYGAHLFLGNVTGEMPNYPQLWSTGSAGVITTNIPLSEELYHPGGIQAIGQYVIVGMDNGSSPENSLRIYHVGADSVLEVNALQLPTKAQSVGIVNEADGRYLVTVGSSSSKVIDFYRTSGTQINDPLRHVGRWTWEDEGFSDDSIDQKHIDYQNINPVRECGTNKLFLIATGRENTWFDGGEFSGDDYAQVFEVLTPIRDNPDDLEYEIVLKKVARKHFYFDDGNWMAGGSVFISDDGKLHFYAMEHGYSTIKCSRSWFRCNRDKPAIFRVRFDEVW